MLSKVEKNVLLLASFSSFFIIAELFLAKAIDATLFMNAFISNSIVALLFYLSLFIFCYGFIIIAKKEKNKFLENATYLLFLMFIIPPDIFSLLGEGIHQIIWVLFVYFLFGVAIMKLKKFGIISTIVGVLAVLTAIISIITGFITLAVLTHLSQSYLLYRAREVYDKK